MQFNNPTSTRNETKNMTTLQLRKSINRSPLRLGVLLTALAWFALSPANLAQLPSPTPDGGYPGQNTAEGDQALFNVVIGSPFSYSGTRNTANGFNALYNDTSGRENTAIGFQALYSNTDGLFNTAIGHAALFNNNGTSNTATGWTALQNNTTGNNNTANGVTALNNNTNGSFNTATGVEALYHNDGDNNTATGFNALFNNTTGERNTANGVDALSDNTTGSDNTALGYQALQSNISNSTGQPNTAVGSQSLITNTTGWGNTATGFQALSGNTIGTRNTANGQAALGNNTTGSRNVATGFGALLLNTTGGHNVAYGNSALSGSATGKYNIGLGYSAGWNLTMGNNNIDIGTPGVGSESNTIRIGSEVASGVADGSTQPAHKATFIAGIHGVTVASAVGVVVDVNGHLGTVTSSARFKEAVKPMDRASEAILALQPVTFRYKHELDPDGIPQFGLVAEQVEKVNPDLVARDADGKVNTVRYEAVNAMLLNEFLKEHRQVQEL